MSLRKIPFVPDEYYHIYSRGSDKRKIFHDNSDYNRFLNILYLSNSDINFRFDRIEDVYSTERGQRLVSIGAYCLMPNHVHILIKQVAENGISRFMHKLLTAYSMYYNTKYERTGGLLEGKFKAELLDSDNYLKYLFSYIHLNPVKLIEPKWKESGIRNRNKAIDFLNKYRYSSYQDFMRIDRKEKAILNLEDFPEYFPTKEKFQEEIFDWIDYK
ncbi:MAG: transposase [Candidatus Zambryskibacteria bacterium]|nr:transposase [Candidatus Zambryskibacteria bacterium]